MRRVLLALLLTSSIALSGCGGSGSDADDTRPGAAALEDSAPADLPDPHYAMFPATIPETGWEFTEAVRMRDGDGKDDLGGLPGVDWYAEFSGPEAGNSEAYISLTGYTQSLDERRTESVSAASDVTEGEISGHPAFWAIDPEDLDSGGVVAWEVAPGYTIELFATGVSMDDLVALAKTVRETSEAEWAAAGDQVSGCLPTAEDCADSAGG